MDKHIVAHGVIGKFDLPWEITRSYHRETDTFVYELILANGHFGEHASVLNALEVLIGIFEE